MADHTSGGVQSNGIGSLDMEQAANNQPQSGQPPIWPRSCQPGTANRGGAETSNASANTSLTEEIFANALDKAAV
jgi:hypothetical protein